MSLAEENAGLRIAAGTDSRHGDATPQHSSPDNRQRFWSVWHALYPMIFVGLAIRFTCVLTFYGDQLSTDRDGFAFGWEVGRVARSLALGHGFASPLLGDTGPTAWLPPVYASLLAAVFKLFGVYTAQSAVVILGLNSLFSVVTVIPLFVIAREMFGFRIAGWVSWGWTLFPFGIYIPVFRIWGESLDALLMTLVLLTALRMASRGHLPLWAGGGMLVGFAALTNPNTMSVIPGLWGWACFRLQQRGSKWRKPLAVGTLGLLLVVAPWFVRNYAVFGEVLPFRSNFWLELSIGNTPNTSVMLVDWNAHPASSPGEMAEYRHLGELPYMAAKRQETLNFIVNHPGTFLALIGRRMLFVWTGFWSLDPRYLSSEPLQVPLMLFNVAFSILIATGAAKAWRARQPALFPIAVFAVFQPLVYYLTHPAIEYRHAIDPAMVLFGVAGADCLLARARRQAILGLASPRRVVQKGERDAPNAPQ